MLPPCAPLTCSPSAPLRCWQLPASPGLGTHGDADTACSHVAWPPAAVACRCPPAPCIALQLMAAGAGSEPLLAVPGKTCCSPSSCRSPALVPSGAGSHSAPWPLGSGVGPKAGYARPCAHTCCRPQEPVQRAEDAHGCEAQRGDREEVPGCQAGPAEHAGASPQPERGRELYPSLRATASGLVPRPLCAGASGGHDSPKAGGSCRRVSGHRSSA